jgi:protoporphyrinogen oxidase
MQGNIREPAIITGSSASVRSRRLLGVENKLLRAETWIINKSLTESEFLPIVSKERKIILANSSFPQKFKITSWTQAFPVYSLELETFLKSQPELPKLAPSVYVTGNFLGRIGLTQILEQNYELSLLIKKDLI